MEQEPKRFISRLKELKELFAYKVIYVISDDTKRKLTDPSSIKAALKSDEELYVYFDDGSMELATNLKGKKVDVKGEMVLVEVFQERAKPSADWWYELVANIKKWYGLDDEHANRLAGHIWWKDGPALSLRSRTLTQGEVDALTADVEWFKKMKRMN